MPAFLSFLTTKTAQYAYPQSEIQDFMLGHAPDDTWIRRSVLSVYQHSGIQTRFSVLPDFKEGNGNFFKQMPAPATSVRMQTYAKEANVLAFDLVKTIQLKLEANKSNIQEITHVAWVSCTGQLAPGMEVELVHQFKFSKNIQATAFNFLGCHGFFHALRYSKAIAGSDPKAKVLIVCLELCTLHFQPKWDIDHILANAIFGDGTAGVIVSSQKLEEKSIEISHQSQAYFHFAADDMAWSLGETGFEMKLTQELPNSVETSIQHALDGLFRVSGLEIEKVKNWIIHPGGKRILDKVQEVLGLHHSETQYSRKALERVGNVSSASVLFALEQFLLCKPNPENQSGVLMGIGPGLTIESASFVY
jgi:predicted naringenin-chalcone synthase